MAFLFEKIDAVRQMGFYNDELPNVISDNINPAFELRPYQRDAFTHFINYFENPKLRAKPTNVLFHMATGSGKTLIMAGLICYLYKQGYRNFLFFVNLDNIVQKTKDNFLNETSNKYLFAENVNIDGEMVRVKEVDNFQNADENAINIRFTTTQGLHSEIWTTRENGLSPDDFHGQKTVLISDEAHHINADTKKGKLTMDEEESYRSWEYTVKRIFGTNNENILLEFTATCDLKNPFVLSAYENKIIFDYPLKKFREEKYSKEIKAIRADVSYAERELMALMFSQYRLKVFQDNRIFAKPVVLFKSKTINESKENEQAFYALMRTLNGTQLKAVATASPLPEVERMIKYFVDNGISFDALAVELCEEFCEARCISVNSKDEANGHQIILNSLEDKDNLYRAIFAVDKLNEGWDVLNLYDIVRLYETRDAKNGKPGTTTISEAQLIGRGARYFPFVVADEQDKHKRKYDCDLENPLRVCEELYYHCQYDSRYIDELHKALIATGIMADNTKTVTYLLKPEFKRESLYREGLVFTNRREVKSRKDVMELLPSIREKEYSVAVSTGRTATDILMNETHTNTTVKVTTNRTTIGDIAKYNYSIVHSALRKFDAFKFNLLQSKFPNLKSIHEFITNKAYLGGIKIVINSREATLTPKILFTAVKNVLHKIAIEISSIRETYVGTTEFRDRMFKEIFTEKTLNLADIEDAEHGTSQNSARDASLRMDLSAVDWYAFNDNFGTSEEKAFVKYFSSHVEELNKKYDKVFLVRNERQAVIYSFDGGERFEPDFVLFLQKKNETGYEQFQIFIEPKGTPYIATDKWKEDFLLQLESHATAVKLFADDNEYRIRGFSFYNRTDAARIAAIDEEFTKLK